MPVILWIVVAFRLFLTGLLVGQVVPSAAGEKNLVHAKADDPRMDRYDVLFYKIDLEVTNA